MVNDKGGINGRKINFISYDDGYAPPKTVEMVRKLVEEDKVLFVFQTLGTPSNTAIHKYLNGKKVPQLFVATGASVGQAQGLPVDHGLAARLPDRRRHLRQAHPGQREGRQDRRPYAERRLRQGLLQRLQGRVSARTPTRSCRLRPTRWPTRRSTARSSRSRTPAPTPSSTSPRPKFAAQAIKKAAEIGWKPAHYLNNVSASVGAVMKPAGFEHGQGILTAAYIKDPTDPQWAQGRRHARLERLHG